MQIVAYGHVSDYLINNWKVSDDAKLFSKYIHGETQKIAVGQMLKRYNKSRHQIDSEITHYWNYDAHLQSYPFV